MKGCIQPSRWWAAASASSEASPRQAVLRWRNMVANLHHAHAQVAGNSRLNRGRYRVFCGKAGEQIAVQILNRRRAIAEI